MYFSPKNGVFKGFPGGELWPMLSCVKPTAFLTRITPGQMECASVFAQRIHLTGRPLLRERAPGVRLLATASTYFLTNSFPGAHVFRAVQHAFRTNAKVSFHVHTVTGNTNSCAFQVHTVVRAFQSASFLVHTVVRAMQSASFQVHTIVRAMPSASFQVHTVVRAGKKECF